MLTQQELGAKVGKDSVTVSRWERNEFEPQKRTMRRLADVLETTTERLLHGPDQSAARAKRAIIRDAGAMPQPDLVSRMRQTVAKLTGQIAELEALLATSRPGWAVELDENRPGGDAPPGSTGRKAG
jgi:transcriptional regulator with XRE-family HTH domain